MATPATITYRGRPYQLVEALSEEELANDARILHDLAIHLRPSLASSDVAHGLDDILSALTNLVRSNKLLIEEEAILPVGVPGNGARIMTLIGDAADSVSELKQRLGQLSVNIGVWALKLDEHVRDKKVKREQSPETKMIKTKDSSQFSHLF